MATVISGSSSNGSSIGPMNSPPVGLSPSRCTTCNFRPFPNSRNLVVCIDGTSNHFGQNNTNVVKLFAKIDLEANYPQPKQFAYYSSGIGTRPKSLHIFNRMERAVTDKFDMAVAWNMEEIVKDAYGWLARTYQEGDQIYLFGFSRGAYQVRVLAGMIYEVGLIRTPTEKQIGTAWDHYEATRSRKPKTRQIAREFKNTFSWKDLRVHFVGVWDTVSSVGLVRGDVFLSTSASAAHACNFRHALALDELRVKFMPEYFHEMNSQRGEGNNDISKYIVQMDAANSEEEHDSLTTENSTKTESSEIKEVWFAGSHSDVGGTNRPGKSYQAGNVSLLWMRREAAASGLILKPTDIVWVPDDLDFGTVDSMTRVWKVVEYFPIKHQISFSGAGNNARRWHQVHPRRIIPGQKIHASILFANAYKPQATFGDGFDIPVIHAKSTDTELDQNIWDTGMFDDTTAKELIAYLSGQQGVAPIYLDRLLFMLRFKEGRASVRQVPGWRRTFENLIQHRSGLVRLVTIVAYYEAAFDEGPSASGVTTEIRLRQEVLDDAKTSFKGILSAHKHRDCPRVVALLRPLARHQALRQQILTPDVLQIFTELLDQVVSKPGWNFAQAVDGLDCLIHCEELQTYLIPQLGPHHSRLVQMLDVTDPYHLTACLRVVVTLCRIPEGKVACTALKPKLRELAGEYDGLVGMLAVEALLDLYDPNKEGTEQLSIDLRSPNFRANIASTLVRLHPDNNHTTSDGTECAGYQILRQLFGLDADDLSGPQKTLINELKTAIVMGKARERTAATMTLLKLCETASIRAHLREIDILNAFIHMLQRKGSALLSAYALATCLKYSDMKESVKDNEDLPKYIVGMLRLDYFDDAVGQVEGFQIFGDIMQHADLREKIKDYDITEVLNTKLGTGRPKKIRTSLICLDIFRSFDQDGPWTRELVAKSLDHLRNSEWKVQKAGVTILSALAQTDHGVAVIKDRLPEIVEMLLPSGYLLISSITPTVPASAPSEPSLGDGHATEGERLPPARLQTTSPESPSKPHLSIFGPACALRILAQNKILREHARDTLQYASLKHLHLFGNLVDEADTSAWRVKTPNRADVIDMLDKLIKAMDEELAEEGLMSIGDIVLPHIRHWDRLATLLRDRALALVTILPALLGVLVLTIIAVVAITPIYLSFRAYKFVRRLVARYQNSRALNMLRGRESLEIPQDEGGGDECNNGENQDSSGVQEAETVRGVRGDEPAARGNNVSGTLERRLLSTVTRVYTTSHRYSLRSRRN